jgi:outer membrane protein assembly factor BamB
MKNSPKVLIWFVVIALCLVCAGGLVYSNHNALKNEVWRLTDLDTIVFLTSSNDVILFEGRNFDEWNCFCVYAADKATGKILWSTEKLAAPYIAEYKKLDPQLSRIPGIVDIIEIDSKRHAVYIIVNYSALYALSENDGKVIWGPVNVQSYTFGQSESTDLLFAVNEDNHLFAVEKSNGQLMWQTDKLFENPIDSRLLIHENTVFIAIESENNAKLFAYDINSGKRLWDSDIRSNRFAYVFSKDSLYLVWQGYYDEQTGQISAFDLKSGTNLWNASFPDYALDPSPPQVVGNQLYAVENKDETVSKLVARDTNDGNILWEFNQDYSFGEIRYTAYNDIVYIGSEVGDIFALNAKTGQEIWKAETKAFPTCMTVLHDSLIVGARLNYVASFNAQTGMQKWTQPISVKTNRDECFENGNSFIISDNRLLVVDSNRNINFLDIETGNKIWSWKDPRFWKIIPIYKPIPEIMQIDDNVIYVINAGIFTLKMP